MKIAAGETKDDRQIEIAAGQRTSALSRRELFAVKAASSIWHELTENLRATESVERLWLFARMVIAVVGVIAGIFAFRGTETQYFLFTGAFIVLSSNVALVMLLRRGKVTAVATSGLVLDNAVVLFMWTASLGLAGDSRPTNDLYLGLFPITMLWASRLGIRLGVPYALFWSVWISWTTLTFLDADSYEAQQLPYRIAFLLLANLLGVWTARILKLQQRAVEESEQRAIRLQQLDDAKDQFIATVSHELKTPLAAIVGFTRLLNRADDEAVRANRLEIIQRNSERLSLLIDDLLDISRIKRSTLRLEVTAVRVHEMVQSSVESLTSFVAERSQQVELDFSHEECWIEADQNRITQVIVNLLSNASKYSPRGSVIKVVSRVEDTNLCISVADSGDGISTEDQEQLFEPFYRTRSAERSAVPGTGLGLYISERIAALHGGTLRISSKVGQGTTAELWLPGVSFASASHDEETPRFSNALEDLGQAS